MRRLATEVDERRNPRTNATVDQLLDRHFELAELEANTLANYRSLAEKHIRPLIGSVKGGALDTARSRVAVESATRENGYACGAGFGTAPRPPAGRVQQAVVLPIAG